jgi:uroporphyrinogen-III synthase
MAQPSFQGLRVLAFESRRASEVETLITTFGGNAVVAPALREVPLESNSEAAAFADNLVHGRFDLVVLLTGVGTRALLNVVSSKALTAEFIQALGRVKIAVRGPKPLAVLRELGIQPWATAAEPNTWKELLAAIDENAGPSLAGWRIAVQEYGVSNADLLEELRSRGAAVTAVPVYQWALPENLAPLQNAVSTLARGDVDVAMFTTGVQVTHLFKVAGDTGAGERVRDGLARAMVASIGPSTSDELRRHGVTPDLEPSHPKMGFLVREAAERAADVLRTKRGRTS